MVQDAWGRFFPFKTSEFLKIDPHKKKLRFFKVGDFQAKCWIFILKIAYSSWKQAILPYFDSFLGWVGELEKPTAFLVSNFKDTQLCDGKRSRKQVHHLCRRKIISGIDWRDLEHLKSTASCRNRAVGSPTSNTLFFMICRTLAGTRSWILVSCHNVWLKSFMMPYCP